MLKFISQIFMMASGGGLVYLFIRVLPRIDDTKPVSLSSKEHVLLHYLDKIDIWLKAFFEKCLRRSGIALMKMENTVNKKLNAMKKEKENGDGGDIFSVSEKKEDGTNFSGQV